jgi:hypothetical protein
MNYFIYIFPVFFLIFAAEYLFIGLRAILINKPLILNSNWLYILIFLSVLPAVVYSIMNLIEIGFDGSFSIFLSVLPIFLIIVMVFYYFIIEGYSIYCVTDEDFRKAVFFSLNNNSIKFDEKFNKIELTELNNELNVSFAPRMGTGMMKLKNKKDKLIFKKIVGDVKQYFKDNDIKTKKTIAIFYLIFGVIFIAFSVGIAIFIIDISKY